MTRQDEIPSPPSFYHVCFAVPDLSSAMAELTDLVGVTWGEPTHDQLDDWPYALVFSLQFPHIELISSVEDSPWYAPEPRFHHLGWWSNCLPVTHRRWQEAGATTVFDGRDHGRHFFYTDATASGVRMEAVDVSRRPGFLHRWASHQSHLPGALDCQG